jgi:hypothetical protein
MIVKYRNRPYDLGGFLGLAGLKAGHLTEGRYGASSRGRNRQRITSSRVTQASVFIASVSYFTYLGFGIFIAAAADLSLLFFDSAFIFESSHALRVLSLFYDKRVSFTWKGGWCSAGLRESAEKAERAASEAGDT